ncbi:methyltransferase domain-containing protein [Halomicroarcula sp. GCM10025894]|uniref:methyltransferase domain-containing protein n=1 Tax=Halomicroarcula sp. GCM10025894 TaxID=3252673 RepID=UPI003620A927
MAVLQDGGSDSVEVRKRVLNLGAGESATGDVRFDISRHGRPDVQGTAAELPFTANAFDQVVADQVLEHLSSEQVIATLNEVHRVLRPGGGLRFTSHTQTRGSPNRTRPTGRLGLTGPSTTSPTGTSRGTSRTNRSNSRLRSARSTSGSTRNDPSAGSDRRKYNYATGYLGPKTNTRSNRMSTPHSDSYYRSHRKNDHSQHTPGYG